jgi:hypothetical protein
MDELDTPSPPASVGTRPPWYQGHLRAYALMMVVCATIAAADYCLPSSVLLLAGPRWFFLRDSLVCGLFVLQVVALAWVTGRALRRTPGRWVFFVWCLVLVNLLLQPLQGTSAEVLRFAFFAGQFALLCIWCCLGQTRWPGRVALAVVLFPALGAWAFGLNDMNWFSEGGWQIILILHCAVVLAVGAVGWFLGFRIRRIESAEPGSKGTTMQFGLKDMLLWMLALMPALLILKSMSLLNFYHLSWDDMVLATVIGGALTGHDHFESADRAGKTVLAASCRGRDPVSWPAGLRFLGRRRTTGELPPGLGRTPVPTSRLAVHLDRRLVGPVDGPAERLPGRAAVLLPRRRATPDSSRPRPGPPMNGGRQARRGVRRKRRKLFILCLTRRHHRRRTVHRRRRPASRFAARSGPPPVACGK